MSETITTLEEQRTLRDVLADGQWHPVLSAIKLHREQPATFWISEKPEKPLGECGDHSDAQCFLVNSLTFDFWARDGDDVGAHGRVTVDGEEIPLALLVAEDRAFVCLNEQKQETAKVPLVENTAREVDSGTTSDDIPF